MYSRAAVDDSLFTIARFGGIEPIAVFEGTAIEKP